MHRALITNVSDVQGRVTEKVSLQQFRKTRRRKRRIVQLNRKTVPESGSSGEYSVTNLRTCSRNSHYLSRTNLTFANS